MRPRETDLGGGAGYAQAKARGKVAGLEPIAARGRNIVFQNTYARKRRSKINERGRSTVPLAQKPKRVEFQSRARCLLNTYVQEEGKQEKGRETSAR